MKYVKFDFSRFSLLKSLEIGNDSFRFVKTFTLDGLHQLKSLKIGKNSFTQVKLAHWENDSSAMAKAIKSSSKSFHLLNCEQLETVEIGECSFSDYTGGFELRNLPELLSITIGKVNSVSRNFYASPFVIQGETLFPQVLWLDLPKLISIRLGNLSFRDALEISIEGIGLEAGC